MTDIVPHGYISVREAVDRLGRELFPEAWTGEEHDACSGLISEEEWLKIKDLPPARGGGATGGAPVRMTIAASAATALHSIGNPSSSSSPGRAEPAVHRPQRQSLRRLLPPRIGPAILPALRTKRSTGRVSNTCKRLRAKLEAGELEAAILDTFKGKGKLHRASTALWRQHDADRMIEKGRAPIPYSPNTGKLVVREFPVPSRPLTPLPASKIREVADALRAQLATKSLTRPQQKDFVRQRFPKYRVTECHFGEIFQEVPVPTGRPKKSDKKG
jgi:hypothetical protein